MKRPIPSPASVPPVVPLPSALEREARAAWREWGVYAKWTICRACGDFRYARAAYNHGPFLCLDCFDQR